MNTPEKRFSTGAITATVWQNQVSGKNIGEVADFKTISLQRSYKDRNGAWQKTNSFRVNDLPRASLVLQKAYEYIVMRELQSHSPVTEELIEEVI